MAPAEPFVFASVAGEQIAHSRGAGRMGQSGVAAKNEAAVSAAVEQKSYEKGLAEGEARARAAHEKSIADMRTQVSGALQQFAQQREKYFQRVEGEVVRLSLSVARKILHREAQLDPLLLTGVVRVALESLNAGTQVRLRTSPQEILFWRDYFNQRNGFEAKPELIGDPSLGAGCCVLETDLGSTQISLETQLKEIEQGFLDLLDQRPRAAE